MSQSLTVGYLFQASQFDVNDMQIIDNSFCDQSVFSTVTSISQTNNIFSFQNVTISSNSFQTIASYLFFNAIYYFNLLPMHTLKLNNIYAYNNTYVYDQQYITDTNKLTISLIQINKLQNITIENVVFKNHVEIAFSSITQSKSAKLYNITCSNQQNFLNALALSKSYSGCFYFEDINSLNVNIFNSSYINAKDNSILSIINQNYEQNEIIASNIEVFNCSFQQTKVNSLANSVYISSFYYTKVEISNSFFHDNELNGLLNPQTQSTTAIQVLNSGGDIILKNNTFLNSKSNSQYNFLYFQSNNTSINNCTFSKSSFDLKDQNYLFQQYGGFLRVKTFQLTINDTSFSQSTSKIGSFIYIEPQSQKLFIEVNYSSFRQGYSIIDGGALFLDPQNTIFNLTFNSCNFSDIYSNSSGSNALSIGQSQQVQQTQLNQINLSSIQIVNTFGGSNSAFLNAIKCQIIVQSMIVTQNKQFQIINQFSQNMFEQQTTFQIQNSEVTINKLNFSNLNSLPNGNTPNLISSISSNVAIQNSIVENISFIQSLIDFNQGQLTIENTEFQNIHQITPKLRIIEESTQNNQGSYNSLIRITNSSLKILQNSVFNTITCLSNCQGSSIFSSESALIIQDCRFVDSKSSNGGSISVFGLNSNNNIIENTYFINNGAQNNGGAFYFQAQQQDVFQLNILNCKFTQNKAQGYGGAIYINSQAQNTQQQNILLSNTQIYQNSALVAGGIYNIGINPKLEQNSKIYNNQAYYYGADKFSYPQELYLLNQESYKQNSNNNQAKIILDQFKSGDTLPSFIFQLRDETLKPVAQLQGQQLQAEIKASNYLSFRGETKVNMEPVQNVFIFKEIALIGKPGQISFIEFTSDSIKVFNSSTQSYEQSYSYPVQVNFRDCKKGEIVIQYSNNFQECQACDEGKYSLDFSGCYSCPYGGECTGGVIYLKQGFWREELYSSEIIECTNRLGNCIGNSYGNAVCIEGNIGPLCEECDIYGTHWKTSYTKKNKFECIKCKDSAQNIWKLVLSILWIFFAVYLTVRRDKKNQRLRVIVNAFYKKNIYAFMNKQKTLLYEQKSKIYIKIFINYIQIVSTAVSFNLNIGTYLVEVISYLGVPVSTSVDYLECILKNLNSVIPLIYLKLIFSILSPLFVFLLYLIYEIKQSLVEFAKLNQSQIKEIFSSIRNTKTNQLNENETDNQINSKKHSENPFLRDASPAQQLESLPNSHRQMMSIETDSSNFNTQMINCQTDRLYTSCKPKSLLNIEQKHLTNSQKPNNIKFKISYLQAHSGDIQEESQAKEISLNNQIDNNQKLNVTENSSFKNTSHKNQQGDSQNELELITSQNKDDSFSEKMKSCQNI
ncbi:hypothetical protein ABPG74_013254 [Tetrahymena malaccensis]